MKPFIFLSLIAFLTGASSAQETETPKPVVAFRSVDLYVTSPDKPLAAYQIELSAPSDALKFVGIEGGEPPAFGSPPFYDPKALQRERLILAAYSTGEAAQLPQGKIRVAVIHFQTAASAQPDFEVKVHTAATVGGEKISIKATVEERKSE